MQGQLARRVVATPVLVAALLLGAAACGSSHPSHPATHTSSTPSANTAALACRKLSKDLASAQSQLISAASNPSTAKPKVEAFAAKLERDAAGGSARVGTAVHGFVAALQHAVKEFTSGSANVSALTQQLTKSANSITTACRSSS